MHLIVNGDEAKLVKLPSNVVALPRVKPGLTVKRPYLHYQGRLTIGKINLWRHHVRNAEQWGMATFFRKGV